MLRSCLLAICLIFSVRSQLEGRGHVYEQLFNAVDKDGNRFISRAEFDSIAPSLDIDGDGTVTEAEFLSAYLSSTAGAHDPAENRHAGESLFTAIDTNSDGQVPVSQLGALFQLFDSDGDGEVSNLEFLQEWFTIHPEHGTHPGQHGQN